MHCSILVLLLQMGEVSMAQTVVLEDAYESVVVERRVSLVDLPSASGMASFGAKRWLVAGDDANALFTLDENGQIVSKHLLPHQAFLDENGRVPKAIKRDYEAIASYVQRGEERIIVFGSGSKIPERAWIVMGFWYNGELYLDEFPAVEFYAQFMNLSQIPPALLNLEGATVIGDRMVILNRELNMVCSMSLEKMRQYLFNYSDMVISDMDLGMETKTILLPSFAGTIGGLSGACADTVGGRLIFSASVEDKTGTIQDGQILGSYVGWFDWATAGDTIVPKIYHLVDNAGNRLFDKLESVEILSWENDGMRLMGVTDDDLGGSEWLQIFVPNALFPRQPALSIEPKH